MNTVTSWQMTDYATATGYNMTYAQVLRDSKNALNMSVSPLPKECKNCGAALNCRCCEYCQTNY